MHQTRSRGSGEGELKAEVALKFHFFYKKCFGVHALEGIPAL